MAKLIDADAFIEMMEEKCDHESAIDEWVLAVCKGGINKMLPVDAVEVVRCKDCKYKDWDNKEADAIVCLRLNDGNWRTSNDFCSWGEKMDGGDKE